MIIGVLFEPRNGEPSVLDVLLQRIDKATTEEEVKEISIDVRKLICKASKVDVVLAHMIFCHFVEKMQGKAGAEYMFKDIPEHGVYREDILDSARSILHKKDEIFELLHLDSK